MNIKYKNCWGIVDKYKRIIIGEEIAHREKQS